MCILRRTRISLRAAADASHFIGRARRWSRFWGCRKRHDLFWDREGQYRGLCPAKCVGTHFSVPSRQKFLKHKKRLRGTSLRTKVESSSTFGLPYESFGAFKFPFLEISEIFQKFSGNSWTQRLCSKFA